MTGATERAERVARLTRSRQEQSAAARARIGPAVSELEDAGIRVSVAAVARKAGVSDWLVRHTPDAMLAVREAQARQREGGIEPHPLSPRDGVSAASLRTDLALARDDIKRLRNENRQLRQALQRRLGASAEQVSTGELRERIRELESHNGTLLAQRDHAEQTSETRQQRIRELEEQVEGQAAAIEQLMRDLNSRR